MLPEQLKQQDGTWQKKADKEFEGHFVREKHVASIFSFGEVLV
jgi:hypothetical protein